LEEQLLKYFADLKYKEQRDLYAKITYLLKRKDKSSLQEEMFYQYLIEELAKNTKDTYVPFHIFKKTRNYAEYKKAVDTLDVLLLKLMLQDTVQRRLRLCFYKLCVELVVSDMKKRGIDLFIRSTLYAFRNTGALLQAVAPGYAKAGLFKMILEAKYKGVKI
jgi:hypothetical protein